MWLHITHEIQLGSENLQSRQLFITTFAHAQLFDLVNYGQCGSWNIAWISQGSRITILVCHIHPKPLSFLSVLIFPLGGLASVSNLFFSDFTIFSASFFVGNTWPRIMRHGSYYCTKYFKENKLVSIWIIPCVFFDSSKRRIRRTHAEN